MALCAAAVVCLMGADQPQPKVEDLRFLAGQWKTEIWGGTGEEVWTQPLNGNMTCMFRFHSKGKLAFTEFITLDETAEGPVMYMRHFYPGLKAWEEKDGALAWKVLEHKPNMVLFGRDVAGGTSARVRYTLESPDSLVCVLVRTKDGKTQEDTFRYQRVR
jgi:hypothetical protein